MKGIDYREYRPAYNPAFVARVRAKLKAKADGKKQARQVRYDLPEPRVFAGIPEIVERIVLEVAASRQVMAGEIMGHSRNRKVTAARQEAMYRIKQERPTLSAGQIGKWFRRDHSSVIHAFAAHAERAGLPSFTTIDLDAKRERQREAARERGRIKTGYYERRAA